MRRLYQNHMSDSEGAQSIDKGGTGATTLPQGAKNLGLVTRDMANRPNGVLLLNILGALDKNALPGSVSDPSNPSLYGDDVVTVNQTLTLKITNYDSFVNYTVSAVGGTAVVKGEDVIFTAGSTAAAGSITLNGKSYGITVVSAPEAIVATPSITSPVNGATSMAVSVTVTSSAFSITNSTDTHLSSDWEISTDSSFATTFAQSLNDTVNKTSWTVSGLAALTKYYLRTRQKSSGGKLSAWSPISNFTTKATYPSAQVQLLFSPYMAETEFFGYGVALSSDASTLVVGAPGNDSVFTEQGTAYLFQQSGSGSYTLKDELTSDIPVTSEALGKAVAVSADGNRAVVSSGFTTNGGKGEVFVYDNRTAQGTGWTRMQMLSDVSSTRFGFAIAISADATTIAVGAPYEAGTNANQVGGVYIYTQVAGTWTQQAHLTPGALTSSAQFGYAVALSSDGNTCVIGAPYEDGALAEAGAVYVFTRSGSTWTLLKKLTATTVITGAHFGFSVALTPDGSRAVVGAPDTKVTQTAQGAAWICQRTVSGTDWSVTARLLANSPVLGETLGYSVAISSDGNTVLAGAPGINATNQSTVHRACVFTCTTVGGTPTWVHVTDLTPAAVYYSNFGYSVALSGDGLVAAVGDYHNAAGGAATAGDVVIFK